MSNINVDALIQRLPDDIIRHIFLEYFHYEFHFQIFLRLLSSRKSKELNITDIKTYIPFILSQPKLCNYVRENLIIHDNYKLFDNIYIEHKIEKKKPFTAASKGNSVALSLLMYMYH